jgi:hypothetical protein
VLDVACVSMIRNEIDILPAWLQHVAALFDTAIFMDHGSIDGSLELLQAVAAEKPGWRVWRIEDPGYHQDTLCTFAMKWAFTNTDCSAVVFLDADEFLGAPRRTLFEATVQACVEQGFAGCFGSAHCLPHDNAPIEHGGTFLRAAGPLAQSKVVMPRALHYRHPGLTMSVGNHHFSVSGRSQHAQTIGYLLHFPLRNLEQMKRKIVTGALSLLCRGDMKEDTRSHWVAATRRLAAMP